jgi:hypothetical protein
MGGREGETTLTQHKGFVTILQHANTTSRSKTDTPEFKTITKTTIQRENGRNELKTRQAMYV